MFALWLKDTQAGAHTRDGWDPMAGWDPKAGGPDAVTFSVVPLAGATPGNAVFAQYYYEQLLEQITRLHNPCDVVPLAWYLPDMQRIKNIYYTSNVDIQPSLIEQGHFDVGIDLAKNKDYAQIAADQPPTWGQINTDTCYSKFAEQAAWQHHSGYCNTLSLTMPAVSGYCVS